jgi:hypothetical protein
MESLTETFGAQCCLAGLALGLEERQALSQQGFVSVETRGSRRYFKLRFRLAGKQCVRYLGNDPALAERVLQELYRLQNGRRLKRELCGLMRIAAKSIRGAKQRLAPLLPEAGYAFHGLSIRKQRNLATLPAIPTMLSEDKKE